MSISLEFNKINRQSVNNHFLNLKVLEFKRLNIAILFRCWQGACWRRPSAFQVAVDAKPSPRCRVISCAHVLGSVFAWGCQILPSSYIASS